jgi:hypothetical protein
MEKETQLSTGENGKKFTHSEQTPVIIVPIGDTGKF